MTEQEMNATDKQEDQLWQQLKNAKLTTQEERPNIQESDDDWTVRILQGIGGWFVALFLVIFLGYMVYPIIGYPWLSGILGLIMNYAAFHYYHQSKKQEVSEFLRHLFLVLSLTGQSLVSFAVAKFMGWQHDALLLVLAGYQLVLVILMHDFVHRLMSALFALALLVWGHEWMLATGFYSALLSILLVWLWLDKVGWQSAKKLYEPMAYAVALAIVAVNVCVLSFDWLFNGSATEGWVYQYGTVVSGFLHLLAYTFLYFRLRNGTFLAIKHAENRLMIATLVILGGLGFVIPGLSGALLLLLVGFAVRKGLLMGLAVLSMLCFISWYYYQLDVTLLIKSVILAILGLSLLLLAWFGRTKSSERGAPMVTKRQAKPWLVMLTIVMTFAVVNAGIYQKQQLIQQGDLLYLKLAPVDPRSIMQGDYMRLRFDVMNQAESAMHSKDHDTAPQLPDQGIIAADQQQVGQWYDFYRGQTLADNHYLIDLNWQRHRLRLATDAYFFQEGSASNYEQAEFGGFKVNRKGDAVLIGLYDEKFNRLAHSPAAEN